MTYREMMDKEGYSDGTVGAVQTFFFRREDGPWTSESLSTLMGVDVVIRLSEALGQLGIYPAVDPLTSRSRLLESSDLGREHLEIAERVRQALVLLAPGAPEGDPLSVSRARKLQRFFAQPFFCAEPYTRRPGVTVGVSDILRGCREILDGIHDALPEDALARLGTIRLQHGRPVAALVFAPDGLSLASAGLDGTVHIWETATGKEHDHEDADGQHAFACVHGCPPSRSPKPPSPKPPRPRPLGAICSM